MKKFFIVLPVLAAMFFSLGASIWEGAAAVSTDFPEAGLYVATNSFPRNTVVDLTNLETGKTVRVIVSAGLDAPGLLALVSREVAEAVSLQSRTIGRIRMTQPSDPIAFSRFTEDYLRSGDPDHDPLAAVEGSYPGLIGESETWPEVVAVPPDELKEIPPELASTEIPDTPLRETETDPESAWANAPVAVIPEPVPEIVPEPVPVPDNPETTDIIAVAGTTRDPVLTDLPVENIPAPVEVKPEPVREPEPEATYTLIPEPVREPEPSPVAPPVYNTVPEYTLIPAEERPPQGYTGTGPVAEGAVPQIFSVPAVADLERGKYYLQIGAYSQVATVERELSRVDRTYPLTVQCIGNPGSPIYRVLVGPMNQGESGALLRSFHSRGYKDAFVRRGN
jgi:hypothetical protein